MYLIRHPGLEDRGLCPRRTAKSGCAQVAALQANQSLQFFCRYHTVDPVVSPGDRVVSSTPTMVRLRIIILGRRRQTPLPLEDLGRLAAQIAGYLRQTLAHLDFQGLLSRFGRPVQQTDRIGADPGDQV